MDDWKWVQLEEIICFTFNLYEEKIATCFCKKPYKSKINKEMYKACLYKSSKDYPKRNTSCSIQKEIERLSTPSFV